MNTTRILSACVMAPAAICAIVYLPPPWLSLLAAAIMLMGLWEWLRLAQKEAVSSKIRWVILTAIVQIAAILSLPRATPWLFAMCQLGAFIWLAACIWLRYPRWGHSGLFVATGIGVVLSAWSALVLIVNKPNGAQWLLFALVLVWAADSGAYFVGRRFGRHPLAQTISPNKTSEGAFGGVLAGLIVASGWSWFTVAAVHHVLRMQLLAIITVAVSIIGDLFESLLKRQAGMKDSGHLIPGHGGVLDRIDGVLAALPIFALCQDLLLS